MATLEIRNFTRTKAPVFPFMKALEAALPDWEISLVFAGETRAKSLNQSLRNRDYIPNVLSYEVGKRSGEIVICPSVAKKQAPDYGMHYAQFVGFLFIHGLMHLKGYQHGTTMDSQERSLLERFTHLSPHGTTHRNRNRHRNPSRKSGGGRGGARTGRN